jgi:hypothetical protein
LKCIEYCAGTRNENNFCSIYSEELEISDGESKRCYQCLESTTKHLLEKLSSIQTVLNHELNYFGELLKDTKNGKEFKFKE